MGHPNLRRPARELALDEISSDVVGRLVADMIDTLHDYGGIGLAAPQVNESVRIAIVEIPDGLMIVYADREEYQLNTLPVFREQ